MSHDFGPTEAEVEILSHVKEESMKPTLQERLMSKPTPTETDIETRHYLELDGVGVAVASCGGRLKVVVSGSREFTIDLTPTIEAIHTEHAKEMEELVEEMLTMKHRPWDHSNDVEGTEEVVRVDDIKAIALTRGIKI